MRELIERLWGRVSRMVGRGRVSLVDDAGSVQLLQVALGADETQDKIPRLAEYGFTSMPPVGSDAVVLFLAGERSNGVVVATGNQRYRLKGLRNGDVALYDMRGQSVMLTDSGIVLNAPVVKATQTLQAGNGASGTFTTPTGQTVTVQDGIVTNIF